MFLSSPQDEINLDEQLFNYFQNNVRYEKYNLKCNPFSNPIPKDNVNFIIERDEEISNLIWAIQSSLSGTSNHAIIVGGYGNGKTHLLKYLHSNIERSSLKNQVLSIYVNTPGMTFKSLYSSIISSLGKGFLVNLAWKYLGFICLQDLDSLGITDDTEKDEIRNNLMENYDNIKKMVDEGKILLPVLVHHVKNKISSELPLIDFVSAFLHLVFEDYWFLAWKWLYGENIPFTQRRELELSMTIENDERALMAFLCLKKILHDLGCQLIILLIDEFEVIEVLAPREKQKILNELRHLIDLTPSGLSITLSCAPEVWRTILSDYHAFSERFTSISFLKPLNEKNIEELVIGYLQRNRVINDSNDSLYPFTSDVVPFLLTNGRGNVRQTLKLCQYGIDLGLKSNIERINSLDFEKLIFNIPLLGIGDALGE